MRLRKGLLTGLLVVPLLFSGTVCAADVGDPGFGKDTIFRPGWTYASEPPQSGNVPEDGTLRIPLARLWPTDSVVLNTAAEESKYGRVKRIVPVDAIMVVVEVPVFTACEMKLGENNERIACLIDQDRDGAFEKFFRDFSVNQYFFQEISSDPEDVRPLAKPVPYTQKRDWQNNEKLLIRASAWIDESIIYGDSLHLTFCVVSTDLNSPAVECLTAGAQVDLDHLPIQRSVFGTLVSVHGNRESGLQLETRPMIDSGPALFGSGRCEPDILFDPVRNCG